MTARARLTGRDEDGPMEVTIVAFELDEKARFLVAYGGPPAARAKHVAMMKAIMATVKRAEVRVQNK